MKIESVIPILMMLHAALFYYTEVLGFKKHLSWDEAPTFGGVVDSDTTVFFCRGGHNWLALNVDNIDEYYETIKAKGAIVLSEPENQYFRKKR